MLGCLGTMFGNNFGNNVWEHLKNNVSSMSSISPVPILSHSPQHKFIIIICINSSSSLSLPTIQRSIYYKYLYHQFRFCFLPHNTKYSSKLSQVKVRLTCVPLLFMKSRGEHEERKRKLLSKTAAVACEAMHSDPFRASGQGVTFDRVGHLLSGV